MFHYGNWRHSGLYAFSLASLGDDIFPDTSATQEERRARVHGQDNAYDPWQETAFGELTSGSIGQKGMTMGMSS